MATRKTSAKTPAGKTAAKSTSSTRKRPAGGAAAAAAKPHDTAIATSTRRRAAKKTAAMTPEERYRAIAHAAYLRAEKRGFAPGHEVDDWLAAEAEFDAASMRASD
jgi:hypothetical protein